MVSIRADVEKYIKKKYKASANITEDRLPTFFSDESDFNVTFWNLNYGVEFCLTILPESQAKMYHDINRFRLTDEPTWESCLIYSRNRPPRKAGRYFIDLAVDDCSEPTGTEWRHYGQNEWKAHGIL
ncbi:hypothetical protein [Oribacterium sp. WCC10]|uniref:hypothetical protein n=1 Tax=Oribacterium sp. WCC10 TaxID=1855343 RepID=UPI0008EA3BB5|nr:hypothetical protein [Oribacterium sp. WCC10]SFG70906.1 hypothetical protein SAMN05216356_12071 [Oribacterium sp. WCC10]